MENLPEWARTLSSPLDDKLGITVTELSPQRAVATMPVDGNQQPFGLLHGGANGVLVETVASMAATDHARRSGKAAVGVDLNVTHVSSVRAGNVTAIATAARLGGRIAVHTVEVRSDDDKLVALGRLTCQLIETE